MAQVDLQHHRLTALAALVWSGDLPRPMQQMLFDAAESLPAAPSLAAPVPRQPTVLLSRRIIRWG